MRRRIARAGRMVFALAVPCLCASAAEQAHTHAGALVSFLACPVAQDTGPTTDLCFFVEYQGKRYGVPELPDWGSPELKHELLVEGRTTPGVRSCGGIAIEGRASVMPEIDSSCDTIVPFEGVPRHAPAKKPSTAEQALLSRVRRDPALSLVPAYAGMAYPDPAPPPYAAERFAITYPFDSDRGPGMDMIRLKELAILAVRSGATVDVRGYQATSRLTSGRELTENAGMAHARAEKVAGILRALGVSSQKMRVSSQESPIRGTGNQDWRNRKVEVVVTPR